MQETQETRVQSFGQEYSLERTWQPNPALLAGESPWTEEPGGLQQSMGSQRVRHDCRDLARMHNNNSNEKQVKETVPTWSQNWLFLATILVHRPGIKPMSPALQSRFLTTGLPGKFQQSLFKDKERGDSQVSLCTIFWLMVE